MQLAPITADERLTHLDALRGFALFGILLVNFEYFARPLLTILLGADPALTGIDRSVDFAIRAFAEQKFFPLFSVLFGVGFVIIWERANIAGRDATTLYARRLFVLALIGAAHAILLWAGDILFIYAVLGLVMLALFRRTPTSRLIPWAILFLVFPPLAFWLFVGAFEAAAADPEDQAEFARALAASQADLEQRILRADAAYGTGDYWQAIAQSARDFGYLLSQGVFWATPVLGYFLLGRWLFESGRLRDPVAFAPFFRRLAFIALPVGAVLSWWATAMVYAMPVQMPSVGLALGMTVMTVGAPMLMLGYVGVVVLARARLTWLAPAGRMALTNYLMQSLFWTFVFYGWGLGLWGSIPRAWHPVPVLAFFGVQVAFSHWWLQRFRFGPAEWLWRSLTYGSAQPLRRALA
jgi:uncharacterized protein